MSTITRDTDYPNLVWVSFDGKSWEEFRELFNDVREFARASEAPIVIGFDPAVDMPTGAPLNHLRWTADLVRQEPNILYMYAILQQAHFIGQVFANLGAKLFFSKAVDLVPDREAVYAAYHKLVQNH